MSNPYYPIRLPDVVSVRCPACGVEARFEYASYVSIPERKYIDYFKRSDHFEYVNEDTLHGRMTHLAVYFHGLNGNTLHTINDLPEPFKTTDWERPWSAAGSTDRFFRDFDHGVISCVACGLRCKHQLDWPNDAWFQIAYRGHVLWAFDRQSATMMLSYIAGDDRSPSKFRHSRFLRKIPAHFLAAKARGAVVKKLEALLAS